MPKGVVNCGNCVNTAMSTLFGKTFDEMLIRGDDVPVFDGDRVYATEVGTAFLEWSGGHSPPWTSDTHAYDSLMAEEAAFAYIIDDRFARSVSREQWSLKSQEINGAPFDEGAELYIL